MHQIQTRNDRHHWSNSDNGGYGDTDTRTNLIINYLPQNLLDNELGDIFSTIGPIDSVHIARDNSTGYSYGFGFVNYKYHTDAERAIDAFNGYGIENKRLKVAFARPRNEYDKDTNLYVTNLPRDINNNQLDDIFGRFGTIVQRNILRDKQTGVPRGVAFIRFEKRSDAQMAIQEMNGQVLEGCSEPLNVKVAEVHAKQKQNMPNVYPRGGGGPQFPHNMNAPPIIPPVYMGGNYRMPGGSMRGRRGMPHSQHNYGQREYYPIGSGGGYSLT